MSKHKKSIRITVETDKVKTARRLARETIGIVRPSFAYASIKDYRRNSKSAQNMRNRIRAGDYE